MTVRKAAAGNVVSVAAKAAATAVTVGVTELNAVPRVNALRQVNNGLKAVANSVTTDAASDATTAAHAPTNRLAKRC